MVENKGYFGQFGGSFVPELIQVLLDELEGTFEKYKNAPEFLALCRSRDTALFCRKFDGLFRRCKNLSQTRRLESPRFS